MSSYVTIEEANVYIQNNLLSTDPLRTSWEALLDEDKQVLLNRSAAAINSLPFTGRKMNVNQENAFPRYPNTDVPEDVKVAQIENALTSSDETQSEDAQLYQKMWAYGISSYRIGNLSESIGTASGNAGFSTSMLRSGVVSVIAQNILSKYLGGGYCIE